MSDVSGATSGAATSSAIARIGSSAGLTLPVVSARELAKVEAPLDMQPESGKARRAAKTTHGFQAPDAAAPLSEPFISFHRHS
ncbi:MAG: hypothetical protein BroJett030_06960 [Alphaproteobacteria bacterium]|nr:MAG: hypothetical protein BroJett030_06960 [Alphaproteobacteria bacterium]